MAQTSITSGNIWKQVMLYVLPLMASSLFQQLYTVVDAFVVGNFISWEALGAIDSTTAVTRLLINFFLGLSTGATIVIAQLWGARATKDVGPSVRTAFNASVLCGVFMTVAGLATASPLLHLLNTPPENWDAAYTYVMIYFCGMVPMMGYNMCSAILRAIGDSRSPMLFIIISCVLNIGLDLLFVIPFGWGVAGAAWATVISEVISFVLSALWLMNYDGSCRLTFARPLIDGSLLREMVRLGLPTGIGSAMYPLSNAIIQWGVNGLGQVVISAWALTGKVDLFVWLVLDAFGVAVTTFVAQCYGAGDRARARRSVRVCIVLCALMTVPLCVFMIVFGKDVASLFADDPAPLAVVDRIFHLLAPFYVTFVVTEVLSGAIRGVGETLRPTIITFLGTCLLRIAYILAVVPHVWTIESVALVYPITWAVTGLAFLAYWKLGKWRRLLYGDVEGYEDAGEPEADGGRLNC